MSSRWFAGAQVELLKVPGLEVSTKRQDHGPGAPDISGSREGTHLSGLNPFFDLDRFRQLALI